MIFCYHIGDGIDACGLMRRYLTDDWSAANCRACQAAIAMQLV